MRIAIQCLFVIAFATLPGCAVPGGLINDASLTHRDDSVAWVYQTGRQLVAIGPPMPPMLLPLHNSVRSVTVSGQRVVVYEDALGDFGGGVLFPETTLNLQTGAVIKRVNQTQRPTELPEMIKPGLAKKAMQVCDGYLLRWQQGDNFQIYLSEDEDSDAAVKIFERAGFGLVSGCLHVPNENCLLIAAFGQNSMGLWDALHYVIRVNLDQVDFGEAAREKAWLYGHPTDCPSLRALILGCPLYIKLCFR